MIGNAWVYALSMAVYCTAWTYFGSVGRAATSGVWFLPIYLGPTLAMLLAWMVLRKMIRIAQDLPHHLDRRLHRQPLRQEPAAGGAGDADHGGRHRALHRAAAEGDRRRLCAADRRRPARRSRRRVAWWRDSTLYVALALAGFTMVFGTRHLDSAERHEGMVAAIAFESVVKLVAFLAVGVFVTWGLFDGLADIFGARRRPCPSCARCCASTQGGPALRLRAVVRADLLSMLSVIFLPRQFQMMVVENVDERHLRRAAWAFPLYLLLINLFVLPIALGGLLHFGAGRDGRRDLRAVAAARRRRSRRWRCSPSSAGSRRPPAW